MANFRDPEVSRIVDKYKLRMRMDPKRATPEHAHTKQYLQEIKVEIQKTDASEPEKEVAMDLVERVFQTSPYSS